MTTNRILKEALDAALEVAHLLAYAHPEYMDKINRVLTLIETTEPVAWAAVDTDMEAQFLGYREDDVHTHINECCDIEHEKYTEEAASWVVRALYLVPQEA